MRTVHSLKAVPLALVLAGCALGPKYQRPPVTVPGEYRGGPAGGAAGSLGQTKWQDLFQDEALKQLIASALADNFDLGIASERVEQARARFRIAGAAQYPLLEAAGQFAATRPSRVGSNPLVTPGSNLDVSYTQAGGALSWELDLFGRLRKLTESARAQYLATEEARRGVIVSLVAEVAGDYFTLRERDLEREIATGTRDVAQHSLKLVSLRHERGVATALDVSQAEQLLYTASAQIASTERDIGQAENALNLLTGKLPGDIARGKPVDDFGLPPELPPGLPSTLLERRPDIRQAEQTLIAANAQIGVAKAYYFPQISLTGFLGGQSRALSDLFTGPARFWTITPTAILPIFTAGQVRVGVRLSEAQKREMVIAYRQSVYRAFREVSDALIGYERTREQRREQERLVHASTETARLSHLRYEGGLDSYLQVLDAERSLFQARLGLAQLRLRELLEFVQVYKALGGGWQ
jgi:NodT family efflux transporter outer membrane factor (OMF) lipoprotein